MVQRAPSPGIKRQEREAEHSPSTSAEVKNGGNISPPPITFHGIVLKYIFKQRDNLTFSSFTLKFNS
jgi:hypothetical protein